MTLSVLCSYVDRDLFAPLPPGGHLMLDSGAFSAMTRGLVVTPEILAEWYLATPAELYAALDVIYDPEASRANALAMRDLGCQVMPAIHAGTHPDEVDRLADDGFESIALGGLVPKHQSKPNVHAWMHAVLDRADRRGLAKHGFGYCPIQPASLPLLLRFTSVDTSAWTGTKYGLGYVWDGSRVIEMDLKDRLAVQTATRRWPIDMRATLTRTHRAYDGSSYNMYAMSAVTFLLFGASLMARGGPRVYLAGFHTTNYSRRETITRLICDNLEALCPAQS